MTKKLILACAGAGKTRKIVQESIDQVKAGEKILVVTYTENNQKEILKRFHEIDKKTSPRFVVKGLYTFLLEDIIRPYQKCIFNKRIATINFNQGGDPHKRNGRSIPGTAEKKKNGEYNPRHFLSTCQTKAHTTYLSKLACNIIKVSKKKPITRLESIYSHIYFDEVQDLIGWDYELLKYLSKSKQLKITCVGDFRQTIYQTAITSKLPRTSIQKQEKFNSLGFNLDTLSTNYRSIQTICDFADSIYDKEMYEPTISAIESIPIKYQDHYGIYLVRKSDVKDYFAKFDPVFLRSTIRSGKEYSVMATSKMNFGQAKGLGFSRVLILPTDLYKKFLKKGCEIFEGQQTDGSKNKLYVAVTRAKYSVGFIINDHEAHKFDLPVWENTN